jgi:hypothetical protein
MYVPAVAPAVTGPIVWPPVLVNDTASPETGLPLVSVTVAVACVLADPSAVIDAGFNATTTLVAGPGVWVSVAEPAGCAATVVSVAVIVAVPAAVVEVIVAT